MADSPQGDQEPPKPADASIRANALQQQLAETAEQLRTERGRLASMRRSWSWRLTLPFRALHRALTGSRATPPAPASPSSHEPATAPEFRWHLDQPSADQMRSGHIRFIGWCIDPVGRPGTEIRVRAGAEMNSVEINLPRPDVLMMLRLPPAQLHCGFDLPAAVPPGTPEVVLEVRRAGEAEWQLVVSLPVPPEAIEDTGAPYRAWIAKHNRFDHAARERLAARCRALAQPVRFSILMPTHNTPEPWLRAAIESVINQVYPHWQLCIADDGSVAPHVRGILDEYFRNDSRIVYSLRAKGGHISLATNSALELADGDWITFLDHDDELHPAALACLALEIAAHPDAELIYTDEDKIDTLGRRSSPYFKPDWNPDLLVGQNYVCHLAAYPAARLRALGGLRAGFEGCQDWDLVLRATEARSDARVRHIPRALYHWRMIAGSTALQHRAKDYVTAAGERTLREHFLRVGISGVDLEANDSSHWRASYPVPEPAPLVSILIPTRNQREYLQRCVESIRRLTDYPNHEIVIVDNQSDDAATRQLLQEWERAGVARVIRFDAPFNYAALHNFAVPQCAGELVCLLNNDTEVITAGWLREMAGHALRPTVGAVGAMLLYPDDTIQHAGVVLGLGGVAEHPFLREPRQFRGQMSRLRVTQNLSAVTGACLMFRRSVYAEAGGLDEKNLAVAYNDIDFCLRLARLGYRNVWTPFAVLYHHESISRGSEDTEEKLARFRSEFEYMRKTWGPQLDHDPAYNPNLTLDQNDFGLSAAPRIDSW
jgi:O-antigen biosynthesis protein